MVAVARASMNSSDPIIGNPVEPLRVAIGQHGSRRGGAGPKVRQDRSRAESINRPKRSTRRGRTTPPRGQPNGVATRPATRVSRLRCPCRAGPSGTGKSHFVEALAHAAIEQDLRVAWFTLETLTATTSRAKVDGTLARTVARICRCDLIVVTTSARCPPAKRPPKRSTASWMPATSTAAWR
jgi:IstB-like ATP binding protein